ncbi:LysR family transcriptional regulator [uncultured Paraglaciecola sp.]|uniref:LysR family transcriptional regulator n=1 Tax=uncultured Paraglaciecola sp. TaxID=1765024 RepID=UPI0025977F9F|nr:LysR family transcriptional regulator [uncultured Paraglaciecola sp.]
MDIKILMSFIAVAKHKSFSEAARELHTVQPAISRHISALENELSVSLFKRNSRDVAITAAGQQLLKDAQEIIALTQQAKIQVQRTHNGQLGTLRIAHLSSACLTFIASLVRKYRLHYPHVHVVIYEMTATEQIEAFKNKRIDIGFSRPLPSIIKDEFTSHTIYTDKLVAIVNDTHVLATREIIDLSELANEHFIIFNRDEALGLFDETTSICKSAGFSPNIVSQPKHMQTLVTEVAAGLGVAIAPNCVSKLYSSACHFLQLASVTSDIPVELHYKNSSATVDAFLEITLKAIPEIRQSMGELI